MGVIIIFNDAAEIQLFAPFAQGHLLDGNNPIRVKKGIFAENLARALLQLAVLRFLLLLHQLNLQNGETCLLFLELVHHLPLKNVDVDLDFRGLPERIFEPIGDEGLEKVVIGHAQLIQQVALQYV